MQVFFISDQRQSHAQCFDVRMFGAMLRKKLFLTVYFTKLTFFLYFCDFVLGLCEINPGYERQILVFPATTRGRVQVVVSFKL